MMLLLLLPQWVRGKRWEKDSTMKVSRFSEVCMGFYRMIYKTKIFNEYFVVVVDAVVFIHYSPSVSFCKCTIVNMHSCRVYFAGAVIHFEDAECSLRVYAQLNSCALSSSWSVRLSLGFISHTISTLCTPISFAHKLTTQPTCICPRSDESKYSLMLYARVDATVFQH